MENKAAKAERRRRAGSTGGTGTGGHREVGRGTEGTRGHREGKVRAPGRGTEEHRIPEGWWVGRGTGGMAPGTGGHREGHGGPLTSKE